MRNPSSTLPHDAEDSSVSPGDDALVLIVLATSTRPELPRPAVRSRLMETLAARSARAA